MKNKEIDTTQNASEFSPITSIGGLLSFDQLDDFFDDFLSRRLPRKLDQNISTPAETNPLRVDILEYENNIEVQAALPGVKKEDIEISINQQTITISATAKEATKEEGKGKFCHREIMRGKFQRTLSLPDNIDGDQAQASFTDGILKITIPKNDKNKRKNIEIQ